MGDIIDWNEEKQAMKAMKHMPIVANNVLSVLGLKSSVDNYAKGSEMIVLTNGRVSDFFLCNFVRFTDQVVY